MCVCMCVCPGTGACVCVCVWWGDLSVEMDLMRVPPTEGDIYSLPLIDVSA